MQVKKEVLIKNFNLDKKEYELGRQKLIDLSRRDLISFLDELPVVDHYLNIEINTSNITIIKIEPNQYSYKLFHRKMLLTEKKDVEFQSLIEVIDNLGIFNKHAAHHKKKLSEITFKGYKVWIYFVNFMLIILGILLPILLLVIYSGMISIIEFNFYEHLYFLFTIGASFYSFCSTIIIFVNRVKKPVLNYEIPIIGDFTSSNASNHILQLTISIGIGYYIISLLPLFSIKNLISLIVVIIVMNIPNLHDLYKKYSKNKKKKKEVLLFLSKYLQQNTVNTFEENYIFSTLAHIDGKKIISFTLSNKIISFLVLILSILSPLF